MRGTNIFKSLITISCLIASLAGSRAAASQLNVVNVETHYSGNSYLKDAVKYRLVYCIDKYCDRATIPSVQKRSSPDIVKIVQDAIAKTLIKTYDPSETCGSVRESVSYSPEELIDYLRVSDHPLGNWGEESIAKLTDYLERSHGYAHIHFLALDACDDIEHSYFAIYSAKSGYVTIINLSSAPEPKLRPFHYE